MTPVTADNLTRHELIGLEARISGVSNSCQRNIKGTVVDETRNTLTISRKGVDKKVAKGEASFIFNLDGTLVEVEGKTLIGRPEDRVKKKPKRDW
ncbi:MAG: ribonuclease P protein subunit [Candidatus Bathyarchaeota archaeon]|nr:ribonuclease P protein subunit [Candidatus Bathyarchaeota archaeon]